VGHIGLYLLIEEVVLRERKIPLQLFKMLYKRGAIYLRLIVT
jgi:hypothetical protein